jgi:membrane fusion protein, heavy metal efflux system
MHKSHLKIQDIFIIAAILMIAAFQPACDAENKHQTADEHQGHEHEDHDGPDEHEEHDEHDQEEDAHAGHDHDKHGHAGSDLDKSVEELFAAECEHDMLTHECDECNYEVGVVRVAQDLIDEGLITIERVIERDFDSEVELIGEIGFNERKIAHLGPRAMGIVAEVKVDLGQQVETGQPLVILESIELAEAEASYLEASAEQRIAVRALERQRNLRENNITSEREFLETEQQAQAADIKVGSAKQKLLRLGLSNSGVASLLRNGHRRANGRLIITAPFPGEILELHAVTGEQIDPGEKTILLGDTTSLWVWVDLYESQLEPVRLAMTDAGLPVSIYVRSYPELGFSGKIDFVSSAMDERTRTVKARVILENAQGRLKPGMFAKVRLGLNPSDGKPAIPSEALLSDEEVDFIFIRHEDDYFIRRKVEKGRDIDGFTEILEGVVIGQEVAVSGSFLLKSDVLRSKMGEGCAH